MAATYEPTELATSKLFQMRLLLGDTNVAASTFQDEELKFFLDQRGDDVTGACYDACFAIIANLSGDISYKLGPYSEDNNKSIESWTTLMNKFKAKLNGYAGPIMATPTTNNVFSYDMMSELCCNNDE